MSATTMAIYDKNGRRIRAVNGLVRPLYKAADGYFGVWNLANDDNTWTMASTDPSTEAEIMLDFGQDQEVARVQLITRNDMGAYNRPRTKGLTFSAENSNNQIVFSYDITKELTFELNFTFPSTVPVERVAVM